MRLVTPPRPRALVVLAATATLSAACCGDDGGGDQNPPKETVSDGGITDLGVLNVEFNKGLSVSSFTTDDGWTVTYSRFVFAAGSVAITRPDGSAESHELDLVINAQKVADGTFLASFSLPIGDHSLEFSLPNATSRFSALNGTTKDDVAALADAGHSLLVVGSIASPKGQSCVPGDPTDCAPAPLVAFTWSLPAGATLSDCPPVSISTGVHIDAQLRVDGDRWFRTGFDPTDPKPQLLAQWIADADLDRDGETTLDELQMVKAETLFPAGDYDFAGATSPIDTPHDFLMQQAAMIGATSFGLCRTSTPELTPG